jgi:hypothetical protein
MRKSLETMKILIGPVVEERLKNIRTGQGEKANDMTTWAIENSPESQKANIDFQAQAQLRVSCQIILLLWVQWLMHCFIYYLDTNYIEGHRYGSIPSLLDMRP